MLVYSPYPHSLKMQTFTYQKKIYRLKKNDCSYSQDFNLQGKKDVRKRDFSKLKI